MSLNRASDPSPTLFSPDAVSVRSAARSPSLAARLTAWYAVSAFGLVLAASFLLYLALERSLDSENERVLIDRTTETIQFLRAAPQPPPPDFVAGGRPMVRTLQLQQQQHTPVFIRVLDGAGRLHMEFPPGTHMPAIDFPVPVESSDRLSGDLSTIVRGNDGNRYRIIAAGVAQFTQTVGSTTQEGPYTVQAALALAPQEKLLAAYRKRLWIAMSVALVLCIFVGYEIARRGIRPIEQVTQIAKRIRSTTLDARIESANMPAELQSLAGEFNLMLDRLQESFARISRFSADIAHELRTPVNNLRGVAEVALTKARSREEYHEALSSTIEECVRLSHIIENLLFLARAEDPKHQIVREPLDISNELHTVADFYEAGAAEAGVSIDVKVDGNLQATLNRTLMQRAVGNLLDNSIKHTPPGGHITVAASRANGTLTIDVADTGRGIPAEHLPRVFDRLYRVADDRSKNTGGTGLGLAIVRSIASSHGGSVQIESKQGQGTKVRIAIPIDGAGA